MGVLPAPLDLVAGPAFNATNAKKLLFTAVRSSSHSGGSSQGGVFSEVNGSDVVLMLLTLSVVLRVINFHWSHLPSSVAMALGSIVCTGALVVASNIPFLGIRSAMSNFRLFLMDFPDLVLHYMLGFLLFAAAIEVDLRQLSRIRSTVLALSIFSTAISTLIVSVLTYLLMQSISEMDFAYCLLFGAIVSPTDPVTVISIINEKPDLLPQSTQYFVLGESLLNDAVGVVLYLVFTEIVEKPDLRSADVFRLLLSTVVLECALGALIGVVLAWMAYSAIQSVDDLLLEIMITFVLVGNINFACRLCNASIPLASVFAGLFMGNFGTKFAMKEENVEIFNEMWKIADDTLNSVLFLMIGAAELFWNPQDLGLIKVLVLIVAIICISIFARAVSVVLPLLSIVFLEWLTGKRLRHPAVKYRLGTLLVLTWAGMRGGISIALALGVPDAFVRHAVPGHMANGQLIFFMTFTLVVFSIVVQGLYFEPVVRAIKTVSYRMLPSIGTSGGLGTYVSQMDFHDPHANYDPHVNVDPAVANGMGLDDWFQSDPGDNGDEQGDMNQILNEFNGAPFSDDTGQMPPRPSSRLQRSRSMYDDISRPMRGIPHDAVTRLRHSERRQGSDTFQNLGELGEPPTMQRWIMPMLGRLSRQGTQTIYQFLHPTQEDGRINYQLRRSRTAPDNRIDRNSGNNHRVGGVNPSLGSVLREGPYTSSSTRPNQ